MTTTRLHPNASNPLVELVNLRCSLARVAQAAKVSLKVVGLPDDAHFELIVHAARNTQRGWNRLAAQVCEEVANREPT
jgi:hypothetical protein